MKPIIGIEKLDGYIVDNYRFYWQADSLWLEDKDMARRVNFEWNADILQIHGLPSIEIPEERVRTMSSFLDWIRETLNEIEKCNGCGVLTREWKTTHIAQRIGYVEGAGQFCLGCYSQSQTY